MVTSTQLIEQIAGVVMLAAVLILVHVHGKVRGYNAGKTDGITEGWKRGWTQPRLANGRFARARKGFRQ